MEHLVDLDDLASKLASHIPQWEAVASVGRLTWRDENAQWPQPLVNDRNAVEVPESVGLELSTNSESMLKIVVWTGGWADADMFKNGEVFTPNLTFTDSDEALAAVVSFVGYLLA